MFTEAFAIWERTQLPAPHRRCKYTVSLLMRVWSLPLLARSVAAHTLREFVAAMLLTLVDPRVLEIQEGGNLMKASFLILPLSSRLLVCCVACFDYHGCVGHVLTFLDINRPDDRNLLRQPRVSGFSAWFGACFAVEHQIHPPVYLPYCKPTRWQARVLGPPWTLSCLAFGTHVIRKLHPSTCLFICVLDDHVCR